MRITTIVLLSFGAGMLVASAINHTSALAQQAPPAQKPSGPLLADVEGVVPVVPPMRLCCMSGTFTFAPNAPLLHKVDGTGCVGCKFTNVTFQYGGGAFRLENVSVSGVVNIELIGAAANTVTFLNLFGMIGCPAQPTPKQFDPNKPIIKTASLKDAEFITVSSPYGQK